MYFDFGKYCVILFCQDNLLRKLLTNDHNASKVFHKLYLFQVLWCVKFILLIG